MSDSSIHTDISSLEEEMAPPSVEEILNSTSAAIKRLNKPDIQAYLEVLKIAYHPDASKDTLLNHLLDGIERIRKEKAETKDTGVPDGATGCSVNPAQTPAAAYQDALEQMHLQLAAISTQLALLQGQPAQPQDPDDDIELGESAAGGSATSQAIFGQVTRAMMASFDITKEVTPFAGGKEGVLEYPRFIEQWRKAEKKLKEGGKDDGYIFGQLKRVL